MADALLQIIYKKDRMLSLHDAAEAPAFYVVNAM